MDSLTIIMHLLISALLGAFVGLEREVHTIRKNDREAVIFGGFRSYTLISLLGSLGYLVGQEFSSPYFVIFVGTVVAIFLGISYAYATHQKQYGLTSEFAALIVYILGVLVMMNYTQIALFVGILLVILLDYKSRLMPWLAKIGPKEMTLAITFAVITLVILPLFPDTRYSLHALMPFIGENSLTTTAFLNFHSIWLFVVIMSSVSYLGYLLSHIFSEKQSTIFVGALGGLVSSTAVTTSMSLKSQSTPDINPLIIATLISSTIMLCRVLFIVAIFDSHLLTSLLAPIVSMIGATLVFIVWKMRKYNKNTSDIPALNSQENPLQLSIALKFALLIIVIKFFSMVALVYEDHFSGFFLQIFAFLNPDSLAHIPLYSVAFFSGLADVDAITQQMAEVSASGSISTITASAAILIAVITNTLVKIGFARKFGTPAFGKTLSHIFSIILCIGIFVLILEF